MIHIDKIQTLLPLGYLYLVILGILNETVFFYQLDINILKYSSLMDILISPIATLVSNPIIFIAIISLIIFSYKLPSILYNHGHKKWVIKIFELKKSKNEFSDSEIKNYYQLISIKTLAITLFSIYLGYGTAEGYYVTNQIKNNKVSFNSKLNYNTGESENIYIIESNSLYFFYVLKGEKHVKIAPVNAIKSLELLGKTKYMRM